MSVCLLFFYLDCSISAQRTDNGRHFYSVDRQLLLTQTAVRFHFYLVVDYQLVKPNMASNPPVKKVVFKCDGNVEIADEEADPHDDHLSKSSSTESLTIIGLRRELIRLESLVRCHVQHQWHLSMENYRFIIHN